LSGKPTPLERLELDMNLLLNGRKPRQAVLDKAPILNWWRPERCKDMGMPGGPPAGFYLVGVFGIHRPHLGATLQATDEVCWMDSDFRWCRCVCGWWRLGESEGDIPLDMEL
jgi:hypothetical protein